MAVRFPTSDDDDAGKLTIPADIIYNMGNYRKLTLPDISFSLDLTPAEQTPEFEDGEEALAWLEWQIGGEEE